MVNFAQNSRGMLALLIALGVLLMIVVALAIVNKIRKGQEVEDENRSVPDADCCGAHEVCDKDLENFLTNETLYFEDEDLDRFSNYEAPYQEHDVEEFRDVLYTLKTKEISQWITSLEFRKIDAPEVIREEAMMLMEG